MRTEREIQDKINELDDEKSDEGVDYRDREAMITALEWSLNEVGEL